MLGLGLVAAASPVALMYLLVNLYAAGVSVYFGGDLGQARLREDFLQPFADFMARGGGLPALYAVLTAGAASAVTRASGAANTVQGVLLGLVSAVGIQLIGRAFGPFATWELVAYPLLGAAAGWGSAWRSAAAPWTARRRSTGPRPPSTPWMPRGTSPPTWARTSRVRTGSG